MLGYGSMNMTYKYPKDVAKAFYIEESCVEKLRKQKVDNSLDAFNVQLTSAETLLNNYETYYTVMLTGENVGIDNFYEYDKYNDSLPTKWFPISSTDLLSLEDELEIQLYQIPSKIGDYKRSLYPGVSVTAVLNCITELETGVPKSFRVENEPYEILSYHLMTGDECKSEILLTYDKCTKQFKILENSIDEDNIDILEDLDDPYLHISDIPSALGTLREAILLKNEEYKTNHAI